MIKPDKVVTTTCPYCGVGCTLNLHIKDEFIYHVSSPFDSPVNHGNLCVKGRFGYDFVYHPNRVTTPLIRIKPQKAGERTQAFDRSDWRDSSWDEALDLCAERLVNIFIRDGSDALAAYCCAKATNEDNYLMQKMFRALFRTNNIDHCTRLCHAGSVVALQQAIGSSAMSNTASEVILSDVFIVTGSNTTENHPIISLQMKSAIKKFGAKLIVIDPRRIELVEFAELWLPLKPGTNVPLFNSIAHVIVKENLINNQFIGERTEGYAEFLKSVEKFTPEFAETITGVTADKIIKTARLYAGAKNAAIYWGMGISQLSHGTASALSLINLALLTGQIGRPGTGLNPLRGQNNVQGASDMGAMPFHFPGYMRVDQPGNTGIWEKTWNLNPGELSNIPGLTTTEILSHAHDGGVRALYIMGENPMMSEPNLNKTRHHMQQLEFIIAQDLFINESAAFADVFLPASPFTEKSGTFTNTDRRVQRVRPAHPPRGDSRPDSVIICDLAHRIEKKLNMKSSAGWDYDSPDEIFAEMAAIVPDFAGINYDRIDKVGIQYPAWDSNHPGTPTLFLETFPRGRGKFIPVDYVPSVEPVDSEYPFILTTGRILEHWHGGTMTRHSKLDDLAPEAYVEIHPIDAEIQSIRNNEFVTVISRRGKITLRAKITEKTTVGVLFIPFHFAESAANLLTIDALDPQALIPEFKACAVQVFRSESNITDY